MGKESKKYRSFRMCLNINDKQFKTNKHNYGSTYMNPLVITNQKATVDTQTPKRKAHKHITKENHQITRAETKINK